MDKNNGLQEINNAKEAESIEKNNTFLEKIKKYLNDANFLSKSIVTITAIYAAFYFVRNCMEYQQIILVTIRTIIY